jgi:predicted deacylase
MWFHLSAYSKVPVQGIFYCHFTAGDSVRKDEIIGYITDLFGNKLQGVKAAVPRTILYKVETLPVNEEETLFCIGYNK